MSDDTFEVEAESKISTERAVLVLLETGEEIWVPQSVIHENSEIWKGGQEGKLVVASWWAKSRGLL
jgi:hypothetical protein